MVAPGMRAMTYSRYGDNSVLEMTDLPRPKVGPGQVLIRIRRSSVNPVDWKVMSGGLDAMMDAHFPVVPGWDVVGIVEEVGPDTPEFSPGQRVAAYARKMVVSGGTFAEYVTVPAEFAAVIPEGVEDDVAGALPLTGLTARRSVDVLAPTADDTVLIHAASGGVGYLACQLAVATGAVEALDLRGLLEALLATRGLLPRAGPGGAVADDLDPVQLGSDQGGIQAAAIVPERGSGALHQGEDRALS